MKRLSWMFVPLAVTICGCDGNDGDRLTRVGWTVSQNIQALVPERMPFVGSLGLPKNSTREQSVRERFRSDRYLGELTIEIIGEPGTIRLRGQVADAVLKRRAVEIAESTVGVEKVIDEIVVAK